MVSKNINSYSIVLALILLSVVAKAQTKTAPASKPKTTTAPAPKAVDMNDPVAVADMKFKKQKL